MGHLVFGVLSVVAVCGALGVIMSETLTRGALSTMVLGVAVGLICLQLGAPVLGVLTVTVTAVCGMAVMLAGRRMTRRDQPCDDPPPGALSWAAVAVTTSIALFVFVAVFSSRRQMPRFVRAGSDTSVQAVTSPQVVRSAGRKTDFGDARHVGLAATEPFLFPIGLLSVLSVSATLGVVALAGRHRKD